MEAKASAKYIRGSAQKARLVIDMVRGKSVNQALATLQFTNKRAAAHIESVVRSAIANATESATRGNVAIDPDDLWIKEAFVDMGPTKSRFRTRPAPQGRAYRERRHYCHISLVVSSDEMPERKNSKPKFDAAKAKPRRVNDTATNKATKTSTSSSVVTAGTPVAAAATTPPPTTAADDTTVATASPAIETTIVNDNVSNNNDE